MEWSPEASGKRGDHVEQQLATLQDENHRLSEQIKRLVRTEHELYQFQGQLDDQIRIYRLLYEVGKKLNATLDLGEILQIATQFVLYQLGFERCVALSYDPETNGFYVEAHDGYYDETSQARLTGLRFSMDDPALALILADRERVICAEDCDQEDLLALGQVLEMAEFVAFPLGVEPRRPIGLLIAGNAANSAAYRTRIQPESEFVVGLANLVSQVATAIRMRREIQAREQRLEQEAHARERIEQELHVARRIQQASLPEDVPELEGWEISPFYRSAREVGGDFYDFHLLSEGRLGLVVGDATGKGCQRRWSCPPPWACCSSPPGSWTPPPPVRYWPRSTRLCWPASPRTCSSPASTLSWTPIAPPCATPTPVTTRPTCTVATTLPRS